MNKIFKPLKKILAAIGLLPILNPACAQLSPKSLLADGLYLVRIVDSTTAQRGLPAQGATLHFSKLFEEFKQTPDTRIVVDSNEYVPLELEKSPTATPQTKGRKQLLLSLTPTASDGLQAFTTRHLMQRVAIVVDGKC